MNQKDILKNQIELIGKRLSVEGDKLLIEPLIIDYDNGGGQSGIRENPFYPAYEKLLGSYAKAIAASKDIFGEDHEDDLKNLAQFRDKFKVAK
jgi:hypothetical protein